MFRRSCFRAVALLAALAVATAASSSLALAATQSGPADLSIALAANTHRARPGDWVYFTITVTNHGPASAVGATITVLTRGGLTRPTLVSRPPDTVQTSCAPPTASGTDSGCSSKWVPPRCSSTRTKLVCHYSAYEMAPAPDQGDSLTIVFKAKTGKPGRERASVSVKGADDPNPANNHA